MFTDDSFRTSGLRVGRLFGIDVWLHWVLLVIIGLQLLHLLWHEPPEGATKDYALLLSAFGAFTLAFLLSVFLHELGHAYAAYRQGGGTSKIVLWPLGGLAYCDAPHMPSAQFWVAAGGPLVNVALVLLSLVVCASAGWPLIPFEGSFSFHELSFQYVFLWNLVLLIVNLLPCYPLDGGRMFHSIAWSRSGTHQGSMVLSLAVSRVTAIAALVFGGIIFLLMFTKKDWLFEHPFLSELGTLLVFAGILYLVNARQLREQLIYGGEVEDDLGVFGYDFSSGYTSLERSAARERRPSWLSRRIDERRRRQRERRLRQDREVHRRLDELLEKIHTQGMDSLSREEQRFLARASKHVRQSKTG